MSIYWRRHGLSDQWKGPQDLIVALKRAPSPAGEEYEVMSGCRVQAIYRTDKYRDLILGIIGRSSR
ncbi:hypothetical protein ELI28_15060 [Rhizobium leguminosarum]|nr:hypothetical protein ELI28_15060 [Rhizobium leguminosarum]TAV81133.1 hypothetical protein ELI27_15050 [Rhizobium leguminosarum]